VVSGVYFPVKAFMPPSGPRPEIPGGQIERVGDGPAGAVDHDLAAQAQNPEGDLALLGRDRGRRQQPGRDRP